MNALKNFALLILIAPLFGNAQTLQDTFDYAVGYDVEEEYGSFVISSKLTPTTTGVFVRVQEGKGTWIQDVVNGQETKFRAYDANNVLRRSVDNDAEAGSSTETSYDAQGNITMETGMKDDTAIMKMLSPLDGNWIVTEGPDRRGRKPFYSFKVLKDSVLLKEITVFDYENSIYLMKRFYDNGKPQAQGKFRMSSDPDDNPEKMMKGDLDDDKFDIWFFWTEDGKKSTKNFDE